jgi:hypothetical protein
MVPSDPHVAQLKACWLISSLLLLLVMRPLVESGKQKKQTSQMLPAWDAKLRTGKICSNTTSKPRTYHSLYASECGFQASVERMCKLVGWHYSAEVDGAAAAAATV